MIKSVIFILLGIFSNVRGQDITKDNIYALRGGNGGNFTFPQSCKENCRFIKWVRINASSEDLIQFTIHGKGSGYIAVAISKDIYMGESDEAYICSRTSSGSSQLNVRSATLVGNRSPIDDSLIEGKYQISTSSNESGIYCAFNRPISVTKSVTGTPVTWDLSTSKFNLFFAEGETRPGGALYEHIFHAATSKGFDLLNSTGYIQPIELETTTPAISNTVKSETTTPAISNTVKSETTTISSTIISKLQTTTIVPKSGTSTFQNTSISEAQTTRAQSETSTKVSETTKAANRATSKAALGTAVKSTVNFWPIGVAIICACIVILALVKGFLVYRKLRKTRVLQISPASTSDIKAVQPINHK